MLSQIFTTRSSTEQLTAVNPVLKGYLSSDELTKIGSLKLISNLYQEEIADIIHNTIDKGYFSKKAFTKKTSLLSLFKFLKVARDVKYKEEALNVLVNNIHEKNEIGSLAYILYDSVG